jgi:hypothetical protein
MYPGTHFYDPSSVSFEVDRTQMDNSPSDSAQKVTAKRREQMSRDRTAIPNNNTTPPSPTPSSQNDLFPTPEIFPSTPSALSRTLQSEKDAHASIVDDRHAHNLTVRKNANKTRNSRSSDSLLTNSTRINQEQTRRNASPPPPTRQDDKKWYVKLCEMNTFQLFVIGIILISFFLLGIRFIIYYVIELWNKPVQHYDHLTYLKDAQKLAHERNQFFTRAE